MKGLEAVGWLSGLAIQIESQKKHRRDFDEYTVIVSGQYTACFEDKEVVLNPGDELFVPAGTLQWGRCIAGTRSIHAFGGKRIKTD